MNSPPPPPSAGCSNDHALEEFDAPSFNVLEPQKSRKRSRAEAGREDGEGKTMDFLNCPICLCCIREPFLTKCGHSFWQAFLPSNPSLHSCSYQCIDRQLEVELLCPICRTELKRDSIFPNFLLNSFLEKSSSWKLPTGLELDAQTEMHNVNRVLQILMEKKRKLEAKEEFTEVAVLYSFLVKLSEQKKQELNRLNQQYQIITQDLVNTQNWLNSVLSLQDIQELENVVSEKEPSSSSSHASVAAAVPLSEINQERPTTIANSVFAGQVVPRVKKLWLHSEDFEGLYFTNRHEDSSDKDLRRVSSILNRFSQFNRFRQIGSLQHGDAFSHSAIISSIEFDRNAELIAMAGCSRKIKIFDYENVVVKHSTSSSSSTTTAATTSTAASTLTSGGQDGQFIPAYPVREIISPSKFSSLAWNKYISSHLVSADYDGNVIIWDAAVSGSQVARFEEHEKRVWSVDYSSTDPTRLASGGDDGRVKIWSLQQRHATHTVDCRASVCCVRFNPFDSNLLAFSGADHLVHYYDIRQLREPYCLLRGHRKAVSYVRFAGKNSLCTASTDNSLKLWSIADQACVRTFSGHLNEKNFVGLSLGVGLGNSGAGQEYEWVSCGSENNRLFTYHTSVAKPISSVHFAGSVNPVTGQEVPDEDASLFVSAVCWKPNSNVVLAGNSMGMVKVLEMI